MDISVADNNSSHSEILYGRYGTIVGDIHGRSNQQSKSYGQRTKEVEEKWNDLLKPLQNEYINCYKNGGPKCTEIIDSGIAAARFCNCSDKEVSTRAITCFFYTLIYSSKWKYCG